MAGAFIPLTHVKSPLKSLFWENSCIFVDICSLYYLQMIVIQERGFGAGARSWISYITAFTRKTLFKDSRSQHISQYPLHHMTYASAKF